MSPFTFDSLRAFCQHSMTYTLQYKGHNHVYITITLCTIITACPHWQDDLMEHITGWDPSFISQVCASVCVWATLCAFVCSACQLDEKPGNSHTVCVCICRSLLSVRKCQSNVYMTWQEFSSILAAIFNQSAQLFVLSVSVLLRCLVCT